MRQEGLPRLFDGIFVREGLPRLLLSPFRKAQGCDRMGSESKHKKRGRKRKHVEGSADSGSDSEGSREQQSLSRRLRA